jgi:hypothetical protein
VGLLSRLFGQHPSAQWPPGSARPAIDLERQAVGPVRLGDALEAAKPFGPPQRVSNAGPHAVRLEYAGFDLEFRDDKLVCAGFDLEDAKRVTVGGFTLSPASTPLDVQAWLGEPTSDSRSRDGLRWLDYERGEVTLALEYDDGKLACVQVYAKGWA